MSWQPAQSAWLADGRLHLHHGPIDLIIEAHGLDASQAYRAAITAFEPLLAGLACELPALRARTEPACQCHDSVAQRMHKATRGFLPTFITPMAAVAGSVADTILANMLVATELTKAFVNNGGDIALHLAPGHELTIASPVGQIHIAYPDAVGGIATSGWRGRSSSLGIADAVTILATDAASADAAATMVANEVNLPGHPAITRIPANQRAPDSDLGDRLITTHVGLLSSAEIAKALQPGIEFAQALIREGRIQAASLMLQDTVLTLGSMRQACQHAPCPGAQ